jgi:hypothetical protein
VGTSRAAFDYVIKHARFIAEHSSFRIGYAPPINDIHIMMPPDDTIREWSAPSDGGSINGYMKIIQASRKSSKKRDIAASTQEQRYHVLSKSRRMYAPKALMNA